MSEADVTKALELLSNLLSVYQGRKFDRITSGTTTNNEKVYYAVTAVNGSATLGGNTTVVNTGDAPDGDTIQQGSTRFGEFGDIEVSSGTVYAYYRT